MPRHGTTARENVARLAGALLGIGLAVALLVSSRPDAAGSPLGATVRVAVAPAGELEVTPPFPRPVLVGGALRPGGPRAASGGALSERLALRILDLGTGGESEVFGGSLASMPELQLGTLEGGESRTYRFVVTMLDGGAPSSPLSRTTSTSGRARAWVTSGR